MRTVSRVPEVMVKVSGGARDGGGAKAHLKYIGRHGKLEIETDDGRLVQGRDAADDLLVDWQLDLCRSQYKPKPAEGEKDIRAKQVHNIVLSMPAGTPPEKVQNAARIFARENFALQHRYAMVLHTDQAHPHVHLVVKCEHETAPGTRLYIRKDTLRQWREQFAALMRLQGVPANATPRQIRGQVKGARRDPIHHRLRAVRAFQDLPDSQRAGRRPLRDPPSYGARSRPWARRFRRGACRLNLEGPIWRRPAPRSKPIGQRPSRRCGGKAMRRSQGRSSGSPAACRPYAQISNALLPACWKR